MWDCQFLPVCGHSSGCVPRQFCMWSLWTIVHSSWSMTKSHYHRHLLKMSLCPPLFWKKVGQDAHVCTYVLTYVCMHACIDEVYKVTVHIVMVHIVMALYNHSLHRYDQIFLRHMRYGVYSYSRSSQVTVYIHVPYIGTPYIGTALYRYGLCRYGPI